MNETHLTKEEYHLHLIEVAKTLTQEQIEACAYVMGASGGNWTRQSIVEELMSMVSIVAANSKLIKWKNLK